MDETAKVVDSEKNPAKLVDTKGNEVKQTTIPVLRIKDFVFSFYKMQEEDLVKLEKGKLVKPAEVIREMRAMQRENRDFMTALAVLIVSAIDGSDNLKEFVEEMKLVIKDLNGKQFYPKVEESK